MEERIVEYLALPLCEMSPPSLLDIAHHLHISAEDAQRMVTTLEIENRIRELHYDAYTLTRSERSQRRRHAVYAS